MTLKHRDDVLYPATKKLRRETNTTVLDLQELSPTSDTNLVRALLNLIDCLTDEFREEARVSNMEDREVVSWIEASVAQSSWLGGGSPRVCWEG